MSQIAQILIEQAKNAAAARAASGAIWGNAVQNISAVPGQVIAQQDAEKARQDNLALARSRDAREATAAADESKLRGLQINAATTDAAQKTALDTIWGSGIIKEDGTIDKAKAEDLARKAGMPHLVPAILDQANKWEAGTVDLNAKRTAAQKAALELETAQRDQLGVDAADLKAAGADPGTFSLFVAKKAKDGAIPKEIANSVIEQADNDPTTIPAFLDRLIAGSKTAAAARTAGFKEIPEGGTLVDTAKIDPATGKPVVVATGGAKAKPLDQQLLQAVIDGDTAKVGQIKQTMLTEAQAKRDPAAAATARELANLRIDEAKRRLEDADTSSDKNQQKFEQQYRTILTRAISSRAGGLGAEDAKVQQANHLLSLLEQSYDAKSGDFNIPRVQLNELALGLAKLVAGNSPAGEGMLKEFQQRTLKGDLAGALTVLTGEPIAANTQAITKYLKDSIERQGKTAETNREGEMAYLRNLAPTDLAEERRQKLESVSLNPLRQIRVAQDANGNKKMFVSTDGGKTWQ